MENRSIHDDVWLAPWDPEWTHEFHMEKQCIVGSMKGFIAHLDYNLFSRTWISSLLCSRRAVISRKWSRCLLEKAHCWML